MLVFWGFDKIRNKKTERKSVRKPKRIGRNVKEYERDKKGERRNLRGKGWEISKKDKST